MIKIRLQRVGRKNDPSFRLIAIDSRRGPKSGRVIEVLGFHNPRRAGPPVGRTGGPALAAERIKYWLGVGAGTSPTAHNLLVDVKIISGPKKDVAK